MVVRASWLGAVLAALLVTWLVWLFLLWQPARQVELHTLNLLARASARDWPAVEAMMAPDYADAWGHDRAASIDEARGLFSHFFALHIVALEPPRIDGNGDTLLAEAPVGVFGTGTAVAQAVIEEVRTAGGKAVFVWRKSGSWPWQWSLTALRHDRLAGRDPR
jgi:hypothetical protein